MPVSTTRLIVAKTFLRYAKGSSIVFPGIGVIQKPKPHSLFHTSCFYWRNSTKPYMYMSVSPTHQDVDVRNWPDLHV